MSIASAPSSCTRCGPSGSSKAIPGPLRRPASAPAPSAWASESRRSSTERPADGDRLLRVPASQTNVAAADGADLRRKQRPPARARRLSGAGQAEDALRPPEALAERRPPPEPERREDAQADRRLILLHRPAERGAEVVAIVRQSQEPGCPRVGVERSLSLFRVVGEVPRMSLS